jgi:hypothetical protein
MKKIQSQAELDWRKKRWDERWEKRVEYLEFAFSGVSTMLPSQITHLKAEAVNPNPIHIILDKAI